MNKPTTREQQWIKLFQYHKREWQILCIQYHMDLNQVDFETAIFTIMADLDKNRERIDKHEQNKKKAPT
jgi:hypothetical protein